jgi:hypothetical protein
MGEVLTELMRGLRVEPRRWRFTVPVASISEDGARAKVKLCTGGTLDVPMSSVKNIVSVGHVQIGDERLAIASGEIDVSTDAGKLALQTAHELTRVSRTLQAVHQAAEPLKPLDLNGVLAHGENGSPAADSLTAVPSEKIVPLDYDEPASSIKVPFNAIAGQPANITYQAPVNQYFNLDSLNFQPVNCFLTSGPRYPYVYAIVRGVKVCVGLYLYLDAAHGTPLGQQYFASITIGLVLVQETT